LAGPPLAIGSWQGGRGLTAIAGHVHELARRTSGPHDEPIRSELPADHVDVDPVHLRSLGDLIIIQCCTALADDPKHLAAPTLTRHHARQYGDPLEGLASRQRARAELSAFASAHPYVQGSMIIRCCE